MTGEAVAQVSQTWVLVGTGICTLFCLFAVSAAVLGVVLVRQFRRRKGPLDVDVSHPDDDLDLSDDRADDDEPVAEPPGPPVA